MSRSTISVVLCTYNGARFVGEQLESIRTQDRLPDQLLVLDDGSSDGTTEIVRAFGRDAPFLTTLLENPRNLGCTKNFERGIREAEGGIIVLSDQDDVWRPEKLSLLERAFVDQPEVAMAFSDAQVVDDQLRPVGCSLWETVRFRVEEQRQARAEGLFSLLLQSNRVTGATMAFRSEYRPLVLPIPASYLHDEWIAFLLSGVAEVSWIAQPLILYRQHAGNLLGARRLSLVDRWKRAQTMGFTELERRGEMISEARERLAGATMRPTDRRLMDRVLEHTRERAALPAQRLRRVFPITRDLVRGRYRRSAGGISSAVRDLVA